MAAVHGAGLLWSQWLQKHPETEVQDPEGLTALLEDPDTRLLWEQHLTETYYSYWEHYTYWSAQGWTVDHGPQGEAPEEENRESADRSIQDLDQHFGHSCSLEDPVVNGVEAATHCHNGVITTDCCSADEPQDGGGERKRAAGSSENNSAAHTGWSTLYQDSQLFDYGFYF